MGTSFKRPSPHLWVPSTYFAEGFPYSVVNSVAEVYFQQMGASLGAVGLTSLLHLPWNLKLLWAPLVDRIESKKFWLVTMQLLSAALLGLLMPATTLPSALVVAAAVFFVVALASATNDVAIDGYYMEVLDPAEQSRFVGYRAAAYKVSSLVVRGPLLGIVGVAGWGLGFGAMALVLGGLGVVHGLLLAPDRQASSSLRAALLGVVAQPRRLLRPFLLLAVAVALTGGVWHPLVGFVSGVPFLAGISVSGWVALVLGLFLAGALASLSSLKRRWASQDAASWGAPLLHLLERPHIKSILLFVVFFRTGESFLQKMKFPFLAQELGLTVSGYALASGTVGVLASFLGTFIGGALIARDGLRRWIWPFLLAQNVLNLLYAGLALAAQPLGWAAPSAGTLSTWISAGVIAVEEFGAGLGTAVFMVYLMRLCHPAHKAAHFAILTALMSLSFTFAGSLSGFIAQQTGFAVYFALTFVATVPMMLLVPAATREVVLS